MKSRFSIAVSAIALVAMCAFIFAMSAKPADQSDALSLGVVGQFISFIVPGYDHMSAAEQAQWQQTLNLPVRKAAHFSEYALLGALAHNLAARIARQRPGARTGQGQGMGSEASQAAGKAAGTGENASPSAGAGARPVTPACASWAFCIAYAISDELHQVFVPGRSGMPLDVCIDSAGALVGALVVAALFHIAKSRRESARESKKA